MFFNRIEGVIIRDGDFKIERLGSELIVWETEASSEDSV